MNGQTLSNPHKQGESHYHKKQKNDSITGEQRAVRGERCLILFLVGMRLVVFFSSLLEKSPLAICVAPAGPWLPVYRSLSNL